MNKGVVFRIVISVVLILALAAGVGFFAYFTNGFKTELMRFYVEINGDKILNTAEDYTLHVKEEPLTVKLKYTFGGGGDYTVKIVPHIIAGRDFDFNVGDDVLSYQRETNLTDGFDITKGENEFTIAPKGGLKAILEGCYPNNIVEVDANEAYANMFTLVITSSDKQSIKVHFSVIGEVVGVVLDKEAIVF